MTTKTFRGPGPLSRSLDKATKPFFIQRGFAEGRIITDWNIIVGSALGQCSQPKKLSFPKEKRSGGILYVEVYDSGMATQMVYLEPMIIEKIATYFGYKAVGKIKLIQKPSGRVMTQPKAALPAKKLSPPDEQKLKNLLHGIKDEALKASLASLGQQVFGEE